MHSSLNGLTAGHLRRAADIKDKIEALYHELHKLLGTRESTPTQARPGKRKVSAAGRARIAAAARARWARHHAAKSSAAGAPKAKRKMSAAGRARIAAAARKRWRDAKAAGRNKL